MITFNNVPDTVRTPGVYAEIDNSRALQGLAANPQKALIIGEKSSAGSADNAILYSITRKNLADGYFGPGSLLARMCNIFKENNPNTELKAIALSGGTTQASARVNFSTVYGSQEMLHRNTKVSFFLGRVDIFHLAFSKDLWHIFIIEL